jgi:methanethiol S-methyltransferase
MEPQLSYLFLILGWAVYFFLHSAMASLRVKNFVQERLSLKPTTWRLMYSLLAIAGVLVLFIWNGSFGEPPVFESTGWVRYCALAFTSFGVIILRLSFKTFSVSGFLGLQEEKQELKITGIHKRIRHPMYSGMILIVVGFCLYYPVYATWVSAMCIFVYLPIGIYFEEKKLLQTFGKAYAIYKKDVPSIIPRLW